MESQYSKEWSNVFSAAIKLLPEAERLVEKDGQLIVEDMHGAALAIVGPECEFTLPKEKAA